MVLTKRISLNKTSLISTNNLSLDYKLEKKGINVNGNLTNRAAEPEFPTNRNIGSLIDCSKRSLKPVFNFPAPLFFRISLSILSISFFVIG